MARLRGRAPKAGSYPRSTSASFAASEEIEVELAIGEELLQAAELDVDDPAQVGLGQRAEEDHVVHAVQELGPEESLELVAEHVAQRLAPLGVLEHLRIGVEDPLRAYVARHDHDGVREVRRAPPPVGEPPVVEHLEEQVEDVGVRLLDLVREEHAVRLATRRPR